MAASPPPSPMLPRRTSADGDSRIWLGSRRVAQRARFVLLLDGCRLRRARHQGDIRGPTVPFETRSRAAIGTEANLRTLTMGPRSERGGMIACTRLPSDTRASNQCHDPSTRRPSGATMRSIT